MTNDKEEKDPNPKDGQDPKPSVGQDPKPSVGQDPNPSDGPGKSEIAKKEEEILAFWKKENVFKKALAKDSPNGEFVFYDGPPFATGLPHYGHILAGTIKDIIPRYQTMLGKHVRRDWGWDCHGLPIENLIEKELNLDTKKDIEELGVEKFNKAAKDSVLRYAVDWSEVVPRAGRWVDMENKYQTMDTEYTESIWWAFSELYKKDLIYKGHKSMHLCPRCETTLSNFEVNQGYKDIKDLSVTVEFKLKNKENTFVLAWTTTPWTLPGNTAVAVNPEIDYVVVEKNDNESGEVIRFILAKERLEAVFGKNDESNEHGQYKIVDEFKGSELIGVEYKPLFDYYKNADIENLENAWKIYGADYVTTEDGTGIVHLAPAFGEEDMILAQEKGIPLIQHVGINGEFKPEVKDFAGMKVKPKSDDPQGHQVADIEIIKYLAHNGKLFAKEKIEHSYPHCWRCDTPLLNYASSSWFVAVPKLKEKLIAENNKISWVPESVGKNRFGKWLEGARDWAVSRTRYWGAPLPVWECDQCNSRKVFGSSKDLMEHVPQRNKYTLVRHGEARSNVENFISSEPDPSDTLTEKGIEQAKVAGQDLKDKGIDIIITSDLERTHNTAKIIADEIGIDPNDIIIDKRIREIDTGKFNGRSWADFSGQWKTIEEKYKKIEGIEGENHFELFKRNAEFLFDTDNSYEGKNILIVSHRLNIEMMHIASLMKNKEGIIETEKTDEFGYDNCDRRDLNWKNFPHNDNYLFDFHKPYIDEVDVVCDCGAVMNRVEDVFDCWFESGAMPFASQHYPFENLDKFNPKENKSFPADFIAEGLDQTRGWFYTMLVLSVGLFDKSPYKNVIVNGLVLAEDGKKMSKRLKNYPAVDYILDKYGADAMRYYMVSSPVVRAEDLKFSEKGVDEVVKKIIMRLSNTYSFYEMYKTEKVEANNQSDNILDIWIISRLSELRDQVTEGLNNYELDKASRPFDDFVDDLSTWYIRRSRDRYKGSDKKDKQKALETTKYILTEVSKMLSPFMPFVTERIFKDLYPEKESVHLEKWPEKIKMDNNVIQKMKEVRNFVTLLLEVRAKEGIKVRQPLAGAKIKTDSLEKEYLDIIAQEVNVKYVVIDKSVDTDVALDTKLTEELKEEGLARDLIRNIQSERKKAGLSPEDEVNMIIEANEKGQKIIKAFEEEIKSVCGIKEIEIKEIGSDFGQITIK